VEPVVPTAVPPPSGEGATPPAVTAAPGGLTPTTSAPTAQQNGVTALPTPGQGNTGGDDDDGGVNAGVVIGVVIAAIAAAGVLGFAGWRYAQRGQGTGGGAT
jgi:hypothetical protein